MKFIGMRFCSVNDSAKELADFFAESIGLENTAPSSGEGFSGATFPVGESRIEIWPSSDEMPAMTMLQIVVDDAEAWAEQARKNGLDIFGPTLAHGERIYGTTAPGGMPVSVQSQDPDAPGHE